MMHFISVRLLIVSATVFSSPDIFLQNCYFQDAGRICMNSVLILNTEFLRMNYFTELSKTQLYGHKDAQCNRIPFQLKGIGNAVCAKFM